MSRFFNWKAAGYLDGQGPRTVFTTKTTMHDMEKDGILTEDEQRQYSRMVVRFFSEYEPKHHRDWPHPVIWIHRHMSHRATYPTPGRYMQCLHKRTKDVSDLNIESFDDDSMYHALLQLEERSITSVAAAAANQKKNQKKTQTKGRAKEQDKEGELRKDGRDGSDEGRSSGAICVAYVDLVSSEDDDDPDDKDCVVNDHDLQSEQRTYYETKKRRYIVEDELTLAKKNKLRD